MSTHHPLCVSGVSREGSVVCFLTGDFDAAIRLIGGEAHATAGIDVMAPGIGQGNEFLGCRLDFHGDTAAALNAEHQLGGVVSATAEPTTGSASAQGRAA